MARGTLVISSILLICAVVASLACGVLVAYAMLTAMFTMFRMHARQVAAARTATLRTANG